MPPDYESHQPPPALGPAETEKIYACLSVGASLKDAAAYVGVAGAALRARRRADPAFDHGLRQAVRRGKVHHLNKIAKATAWQASVWILERRWRRQFGRNLPPEGNRVRPLADRSAYDFSSLDVQELRQLWILLNKAARPGGSAKSLAELTADEVGATDGDTRHDAPKPDGGTAGPTGPTGPAGPAAAPPAADAEAG